MTVDPSFAESLRRTREIQEALQGREGQCQSDEIARYRTLRFEKPEYDRYSRLFDIVDSLKEAYENYKSAPLHQRTFQVLDSHFRDFAQLMLEHTAQAKERFCDFLSGGFIIITNAVLNIHLLLPQVVDISIEEYAKFLISQAVSIESFQAEVNAHIERVLKTLIVDTKLDAHLDPDHPIVKQKKPINKKNIEEFLEALIDVKKSLRRRMLRAAASVLGGHLSVSEQEKIVKDLMGCGDQLNPMRLMEYHNKLKSSQKEQLQSLLTLQKCLFESAAEHREKALQGIDNKYIESLRKPLQAVEKTILEVEREKALIIERTPAEKVTLDRAVAKTAEAIRLAVIQNKTPEETQRLQKMEAEAADLRTKAVRYSVLEARLQGPDVKLRALKQERERIVQNLAAPARFETLFREKLASIDREISRLNVLVVNN